jgi:hypothetical protein
LRLERVGDVPRFCGSTFIPRSSVTPALPRDSTDSVAKSDIRLDVFVVDNWTNSEGAEQANWIRLGTAFAHKDGKGFNVELKAMPVSGKLVIREYEPKPRD